MNQQGIPYVIPLWAFIAIVCAPVIGMLVADLLIWHRKNNRDKY